MKTVLLVTKEESHRMLYERGLGKHFAVMYSASPQDFAGAVDAVVYDLPKYPSGGSFRWLVDLDVPVVVLTADERLRFPEISKRSILVYPVRMNQVLEALAKLGVCAGGDC